MLYRPFCTWFVPHIKFDDVFESTLNTEYYHVGFSYYENNDK